jgi:hypothetical protein
MRSTRARACKASPSISHDLLLTCVWIPRVGRLAFGDRALMLRTQPLRVFALRVSIGLRGFLKPTPPSVAKDGGKLVQHVAVDWLASRRGKPLFDLLGELQAASVMPARRVEQPAALVMSAFCAPDRSPSGPRRWNTARCLHESRFRRQPTRPILVHPTFSNSIPCLAAYSWMVMPPVLPRSDPRHSRQAMN